MDLLIIADVCICNNETDAHRHTHRLEWIAGIRNGAKLVLLLPVVHSNLAIVSECSRAHYICIASASFLPYCRGYYSPGHWQPACLQLLHPIDSTSLAALAFIHLAHTQLNPANKKQHIIN